MEDLIIISSGSEEDSDIEVTGIYRDKKEDAIPFIRAEWLAVAPVVVDISGPPWARPKQRPPRKHPSSLIVVEDQSNCSLSDDADSEQLNPTRGLSLLHPENEIPAPSICFIESCKDAHKSKCNEEQLEKNRTDFEFNSMDETDCGFAEIAGRTSLTEHLFAPCNLSDHLTSQSLASQLAVEPQHDPGLPVSQQLGKEIKALQYSCSFNSLCEPYIPHNNVASPHTNVAVEDTEYNKAAQQRLTSPSGHTAPDLNTETKETSDSSRSWPDYVPSPFSLDSPYYCPSEDGTFEDSKVYTQTGDLPREPTYFSEDVSMHTCHRAPDSQASMVNNCINTCISSENTESAQSTLTHPQITTPDLYISVSPPPTHLFSQLQSSRPDSPTSTEILASDSSDMQDFPSDLALESPPATPLLSDHASIGSSPHILCRGNIEVDEQVLNEDLAWKSDHTQAFSQDRQYVSQAQYKRLKTSLGEPVPGWAEEEEEDEGEDESWNAAAVPLCRQHLSLVSSTIEERHWEGTLQLLSDFLHPCSYPPPDITDHLLRGILLDPQTPDILAVEAYNLLMRIQSHHPADKFSLRWDWVLLTSVMEPQSGTKGLRFEILRMLLKYVLQVLEDDFQCKLALQQLHNTITKATLSCVEKFSQVRDLVNWTLNAAKQSIVKSEENIIRERDEWLQILLILQRMLRLAVEVDRNPTCSATKLSQELFCTLNSITPCRELRLLLLSTFESKLLRCKLLELMLDQACPQKRKLDMPLSMILHFFKNSTLAPDPADGMEKWRKWDELLQLLWMLLLSHEEVMKGQLKCSITKRLSQPHTSVCTVNDFVTQEAVQEAGEAFFSRALDDLGHDLSTEMQESLTQLEQHLLDTHWH